MPQPGQAIGTFANWITERLATGGALSSLADVQTLLSSGITAIIDCRAEFDDGQLLAQSGAHYIWNGVDDDGVPKPPGWFGTSLVFALPLMAQPGQRILAHCAAGVNRGPSTAYALLRGLGLPPDEAMRLVKAGRPQAQVRYAADADRAVSVLGYSVSN